MKASKEDWIKATENLNIRRRAYGINDDRVHTPPSVNVYKDHIDKCGYGKSILDVGCGSQSLKGCIPEHINYIGIDAFPIVEDTVNVAIEDLNGSIVVDTVCAFAVLDNCRDFFRACENMKRSARQNVIILTGIGIEVDKFHTFKLEHEHFEEAFKDWTCTLKEQVSTSPNVWLLNYIKI